MLRLSVCIDMIFRDSPLKERVAKVAASGIEAVEFWRWTDKDLDALERATQEHNVRVAGFCVDPMGAIVDRSTHGQFLEGVKNSVAAANRLGAETLIVTTGQALKGVPRPEQHAAIVEALQAAAPIAEDGGITLSLEPLNTAVDHAGYYLVTSVEGYEIIDAVDSPRVKLLYDCYHQQISEGNLIDNLRRNAAKIGHIHLADVPGRHEPGTGELNYANIFKAIGESGYAGYVGMEFKPTGQAESALKYVKELAS